MAVPPPTPGRTPSPDRRCRARCSCREQPAPNRQYDRMRPVVGAELLYKVLDVEVDGRLGDGEQAGDLFVPMSPPNQIEHLELTRREIGVAKVLGQARRNIGRHASTSGVYGPNRCQQIALGCALQ